MSDGGAPSRRPSPRAQQLVAAGGLTASHRGVDGPSLGTVLCVHGALDGAASFARVRRRLVDADVVLYDRRGYRSSRGLGAAPGLGVHVDDALAVLAAASRAGAPAPHVVLGHSFGGLVALGTATLRPPGAGALVVYEPPFPWLLDPEDARGAPTSVDPGEAVEAFFRRIVGDRPWERLGEAERTARRLDGPALLEDLAVVRGPRPIDPAAVRAPAIVGVSAGAPRRRHDACVRLAAALPDATLLRVEDAGHGAHLSHPDQLAAAVRAALRAARGDEG